MFLLGTAAVAAAPACPSGTTRVDNFTTPDQIAWLACEDLAVPGGGLTLVPARGAAVHLPKSYEVTQCHSSPSFSASLSLPRAAATEAIVVHALARMIAPPTAAAVCTEAG